jgi:DNA-binding NtrC family response regulator
MNIGSDRNCQIPVSGEEVSEKHARIELRNNEYWLRDLRTGFATYINQNRILEAQLNEGDEIQIGKNFFCFTFINKSQEKMQLGLSSKNSNWQSELEKVSLVARTDFTILLLGPSGSGKEVLAEAVHKNSKRKAGPFIKVNCSALTETLVESELFGHTKGSFTGATENRKGAFESARGGTLFLDEIGDLPIAIQAKLLRALENNEIRAVGSDKTVTTDVRIIAATHQNLKDKIVLNKFRVDLYYRLNVVTINSPALLDRMEDFDDLLYFFAKKFRVRFSYSAIQAMKTHFWPGNIRELRNTVARAAAFFPRQEVVDTHIKEIIDHLASKPTWAPPSPLPA